MRYSRLLWSCVLFALLGACGSGAGSSQLAAERPAEAALRRATRCQHDHAGAPAIVAGDCLFGKQFADIRTNPALQLTREIWIHAADTLTTLAGQQLLRAVQQSSHTDVTTPAEALARVDEQSVRRIDFSELASGREFVVFEYGAGDNSYGAFFARDSTEVLAAIHDGDLYDCTIRP